jgi:hypothetical protein
MFRRRLQGLKRVNFSLPFHRPLPWRFYLSLPFRIPSAHSFADRLAWLKARQRAEEDEEDEEDRQNYTEETLRNHVVTWGQSMQDKTFLQAYEDESYARWCGRASGPGLYQKRSLRNIELKAMADEELLMASKETNDYKGSEPKKKTNPPETSSTSPWTASNPPPFDIECVVVRPKAKTIVEKEKVETCGLEKPVPSTEGEWDMPENPEPHLENTAHLAVLDDEVHPMRLQGRLIGIEAMLTQFVQHLPPPPP